MVLFLIITAWLTLSTLVYAFTVRSFLAHVQSVPVHIVVGVLFSAVLSPGGAVGHGVAPFPGGLMCIRMLLNEATDWRGNLFNLFFWALTPPPTIVIAATNHQELLDHAAWRRFHLRVHLPRPTLPQVVQGFTGLREQLAFPEELVHELSDRMVEISFAELEDFSTDLRRRAVIEGPTADLGRLVKHRLSLWSRRLIPAGYH